MIQLMTHIYDRGDNLEVAIPPQAAALAHNFTAKLKDGLARVELYKWYNARSTGPGSQSHHINGHVAQISMETGQDFDSVKTYCKMEAIPAGYPFDTVRDTVVPWSEARIDTRAASILIDTIHRVAAEMGISLKEV
jgi:hypothetical protein